MKESSCAGGHGFGDEVTTSSCWVQVDVIRGPYNVRPGSTPEPLDRSETLDDDTSRTPVTPVNSILRIPTLAWGLVLPALLLWSALRIVLYVSFRPGSFHLMDIGLALVSGSVMDLLTCVLLGFPLWLSLATVSRFSRWLRWRWVLVPVSSALNAALTFGAIAEYYFFEEFNARFNHIAVDYLIYPHEVFVNIRESYDVTIVTRISALIGIVLAAWVANGRWIVREPGASNLSRSRAVIALLIGSGLSFLLLARWPVLFPSDRILHEIAQNGLVQFSRALWSEDLDYPLYYRSFPPARADQLAAKALGYDIPPGGDPGRLRFRRQIRTASTPTRPWDVVIILEESLGSEFVGSLGRPGESLTPALDRWSREGIFLTHLIATGNRTVRGLEGVLCSLVPLPGGAILRRSGSAGVATLARVFESLGYRTAFFYGGNGLFDGLARFMKANGFHQFIEEEHYSSKAFRTAWGVADEYIFDALLQRQLEARDESRRFFGTLLSVSNHKPFRVPPGRTNRPAGERSREGAILYSDWAMGRYLDQCREKGLMEHTLFLIVGDHGARVYGSEQIPIHSYRIPALILVPDEEYRDVKVDRLCSQIDLAPTLLDLCGLDGDVPFMGESLLGLPSSGGRAYVHHNRDVGLLTEDLLVVLGLKKTVAYYRRENRTSDVLEPIPPAAVTEDQARIADLAAAVFQTAYEHYQGKQLGLDGWGNFTQ